MLLKALNDQRLLRRAVPPLARSFGFSKEVAWEMLECSETVRTLIEQRYSPQVRHDVNEWCRRYRKNFLGLGLGILNNRKVAKLEPYVYDQVICLTWLTQALKNKRFELERVKIDEAKKTPAPVVKLAIWWRIINQFKKFFRRR